MGVYAAEEISDKAVFHGNSANCIFCLTPRTQVANTHDGKGESNFQYLNTHNIEGSQRVQGLGFGGRMGEFRLFFHPLDLEGSSYLNPDCGTYACKYLGAKNPKLRIETIEIFGFGGAHAL